VRVPSLRARYSISLQANPVPFAPHARSREDPLLAGAALERNKDWRNRILHIKNTLRIKAAARPLNLISQAQAAGTGRLCLVEAQASMLTHVSAGLLRQALILPCSGRISS
jgi:hypothetical protein